jgi:hypothetical protein
MPKFAPFKAPKNRTFELSLIGRVTMRCGNYPVSSVNPPYIELVQGGESITTLTVNLDDELNDQLEEGEFFVKTWSENEDLIPAILASGLFVDTRKRAWVSPWCEASIWTFSDKAKG